MHNVTDTFPPTAMMSQGNSCRKLLASPNPTSAQMDFYLSSILLVPLISACLAFLHPPCLHSFGVPSLAPLLPPSLPPPLSPNGGCALSMKGGETRCKKRGPSGGMCVSSLVILKKKKKNRILHLTVFSLSVGGDRRRLQGQFWQSGFHLNRESRAEYLVPSWENCLSKRCGRAGPKMWGKMEETKS